MTKAHESRHFARSPWKRREALDAVVVQNRSYKTFTHRRAVLFVNKKYLVIIDEAIGAAGGDVDVHFQLAPGKALIEPEGLVARTALPDGPNVVLQALAQSGLVMEEEQGQVSFHYGDKEPRPALRLRLKKAQDGDAVRFVTVVAPYRGNVPPAVQISSIEGAVGTSRVEVKLSVDGKACTVGYHLERKEAWVR